MTEENAVDENIDGQEAEINEDLGLSAEEVEVEVEESELSTETGETAEAETGEEAGEQAEKEDGVQKKINKMHREKMEGIEKAEAKAAAETAKREEIEAKLLEYQKVEIPELPPRPDFLDEDYDVKIEEYESILIQRTQEASRQDQLTQINAEKQQEVYKAHLERIGTLAKGYNTRIDDLQLDSATMVDSQQVIKPYFDGKSELAEFILADPDGPLNVLYLSQNEAELKKVGAMTQTNAAVYIATKIAPEAQKLKPKTTNAPDPAYKPKGRESAKDEHPALKGATFT